MWPGSESAFLVVHLSNVDEYKLLHLPLPPFQVPGFTEFESDIIQSGWKVTGCHFNI